MSNVSPYRRARALARRMLDELSLPAAARSERARDRRGVPSHDPGIPAVLEAATDWLCLAQDRSASADGGVARDYSLLNGWATSYPETTGYIIPTMFDMADHLGRPDLRDRAARMLDWFVAIQLADGAYQGGRIDSVPVRPTTFNTGQILLGLARGVVELGDGYRDACTRAAQWLADTLDEDGCWRRFGSPFTAPGEKAYETHVSWGLFEAARALDRTDLGEAGLRQVRWALTKQRSNGWFDDCCLSTPDRPLTHTIGYVLRGILEAHRYSGDSDFLEAALLTARNLVRCVDADGRLPAQLDASWNAAAPHVCLTGSVQNAHCLLMLHAQTGEAGFLETAQRLNRYVRRTVRLDGPPETRGAVKGSFPVDGTYGRYEYLNWAAKFFIDANLVELRLHEAVGASPAGGEAEMRPRRSA
ncbi:MAG: hypothetical protein H6983_24790 [Ectothiorhodospiraceae bacterium]|nr:hypothetical protein [Ectothiorhodospiraceae bacterium]